MALPAALADAVNRGRVTRVCGGRRSGALAHATPADDRVRWRHRPLLKHAIRRYVANIGGHFRLAWN
jgi:hypothetical protein